MNEWRIPIYGAVAPLANRVARQLSEVPDDEWPSLITEAIVDCIGKDRERQGTEASHCLCGASTVPGPFGRECMACGALK